MSDLSDLECPRVVVHPDVISVAKVVIEAMVEAERAIMPLGYNLQGPVVICIDDMPIATIEWHDDAWCLVQAVRAGE